MKALRRSPYLISIWFLSLIAAMILLALGRLSLWFFAAHADFWNTETLLAWSVGLRFDMMVAAYLATPVLLCWLASLCLPKQIKKLLRAGIAASLSLGLLLILTEIINFGFFCEYRDQFNVWVLGLINDDAQAVGQTILNDYHWGRYLCAIALLFAAWIVLFRRAARKVFHSIAKLRKTPKTGIVFILIALATGIIFYRGGIDRRPPRMRDAAPCDTEIVNHLVLNPVYALKHVIVDLWRISNSGQKPEFVRNVREQAKLLYGNKAATAQTIDELILKRNERLNPNAPAPKQIFLVVMESYDRWPMLEKYSALGLSDTLLALEKSGASSPNFAPATGGTMSSLTSILSGIPFIDCAQNHRPRGSVALPTATAEIFKRLGYKTRFAYSGYGLWQRVEDYARQQGFDEIVLGSDVPDCPSEYKAEWGVPDGFLFSHLEKIAESDGDTPVFTLILTASNHPPYSLPLEKLGHEHVRLPAELEKICSGPADINTLSHFKYADRELGKFIDQITKQHPGAVFAVTGDHFSRKFLNEHPTLAESRQVPFVIAGAGIPAGTKLPFGTHVDMVPTLLALCAPDGFEYPSFGTNLFSKNARERRCAFGDYLIVHARGGFVYSGNSSAAKRSEVHYGQAVSEDAAARMKAEIDALRALAWTYFEKGSEIN
ncbi:MAG: LTA synthase family protein [Opitutales bacterium]|nr:LTA synthase family protein [Opitutales bacterium]